jgi:hypothetical protein
MTQDERARLQDLADEHLSDNKTVTCASEIEMARDAWRYRWIRQFASLPDDKHDEIAGLLFDPDDFSQDEAGFDAWADANMAKFKFAE